MICKNQVGWFMWNRKCYTITSQNRLWKWNCRNKTNFCRLSRIFHAWILTQTFFLYLVYADFLRLLSNLSSYSNIIFNENMTNISLLPNNEEFHLVFTKVWILGIFTFLNLVSRFSFFPLNYNCFIVFFSLFTH